MRVSRAPGCAAKRKGSMNPSDLDKAVAYVHQFIEAATPIAKKAYEIGLITLRIDAAQVIAFSLIVLLAAFFVVKTVRADYVAAKATAAMPENRCNVWTRDAGDHMFGHGIPHIIATVFTTLGAAAAAVNLLNVWIWVKLIAPEFWLASQAVHKIVG